MCLGPEALVALALTGAGNYVQQQENNRNLQRQYNAKNAVMLQGVQQQDQNAAKGQNILDTTLNKFDPNQQQQDLGSLITARTNLINGNTGTPSSLVDPTSNANAPKVVQDTLAQKFADASNFAQQQGAALGKIGGTQDKTLQNSLSINDSGNQLGTLSNFARGDYGVNQAQQNAAYNNARKSPSIFGQLLSDAGTVAGFDAFSGGPLATSAGFGNVAGPTLEQTTLPWRNTVAGFDIGPKFPTLSPANPANYYQTWS